MSGETPDTPGVGIPMLIDECGWTPSTSMLRFKYSSFTMAPDDAPEGCRLKLERSFIGKEN